MAYNFDQTRNNKIQMLQTQGRTLRRETQVIAQYFANLIFDNTFALLAQNQTTDKIYDNKNPMTILYQVSFKNPSKFFTDALEKAEDELHCKSEYRKWIVVESSDTPAKDDNNELWRKLWKTYLCGHIVKELNTKFSNIHQRFYVEVFARGGEREGKFSSLSYDSKYMNKIIVKVGDAEVDPTQSIFDELFRAPTNNNQSGLKSWGFKWQ